MRRHDIAAARLQRRLKSECLAALARGEAKLSEVVQRPPAGMHQCDLWKAMVAAEGLGPVRARRLCEDARVWPNQALGEVPEAERAALVHLLTQHGL